MLNCVVVYFRVLSLGLSFSFSLHNLSFMLFLTIQYLTCCMLMTRIYISCNDFSSAIRCIAKCVSDVKTWMLSNKLQMNEDKTEVLLATPKTAVKSGPFPEFININGSSVKFCRSLRNIGVTLDSIL